MCENVCMFVCMMQPVSRHYTCHLEICKTTKTSDRTSRIAAYTLQIDSEKLRST
jgi:hypothetical protein